MSNVSAVLQLSLPDAQTLQQAELPAHTLTVAGTKLQCMGTLMQWGYKKGRKGVV